jgi:hypothetical protein
VVVQQAGHSSLQVSITFLKDDAGVRSGCAVGMRLAANSMLSATN